ncbi:hypothetical protein N431DRAFT_420721 [Stipitochalara longipes BDJ]|nr:hypothetical protein N431DRAFT_420721 [Stipitochalara longipes BDJ]
METAATQKPMKPVSDTPQLQQVTPSPPTPAPLNAADRPIEKTPLRKRKGKLTPEQKRQVAATRKRGACKECRRKKEKCLHATNELGTDEATPALQRSESQDSWCSVTSTSSCDSESYKPGEDRWVATSVSAALLAGRDQLPSGQLDWSNTNLNTRYQEPRTILKNLYATRPSNGSAPPGLHPSLDQVSQGDILSQNSSQPAPGGYDMRSISLPATTYPPRHNGCWPQNTHSVGGSSQSPGYLLRFHTCALSSAEFQQRPALPETCMTYQRLPWFSGQPYCNGCCACNPLFWEPTPIVHQPVMNSSTQTNSNFGSPSASDTRERTVPENLFKINMPSEETISQSSVFMSPMDVNLSNFLYQSHSTFATNISPPCGRNTFEGNPLPSFSSDGTAMTMDTSHGSTFNHTTRTLDAIAPEIFRFPQSSTDDGYLPQLTIPDQDFPLAHEPPFINAQPNHSFVHFS